ncbi:MAG: TolC family protein [Planctomycetota bacterium]|nr:TolC family protein [Planctomycetota bacterium]
MRTSARGWVAVLTAAACCVSASCVSYDTTRANEYIGPVRPAAASAAATVAAKTVAVAPPRPATRPVADRGPIEIGPYEAIVMALDNNRQLAVEKYNPPIRRTFEQQELAAFDPVLSGQTTFGHTTGLQSGIGNQNVDSTSSTSLIGVSEFLPTGTRLGATATGTVGRDRVLGGQDSGRLGLTASQSLLRGYGLDVNLASLRQASIDSASSQYELRGLAIAVAAQAEEAYWDYVVALRQVAIVTSSLKVTMDEAAQIKERISLGRLAQTEQAAADAEVALRQEALINAQSAAEKARLALLRLINPPGPGAFDRRVEPRQQLIAKQIPLEALKDHLELARRMRPELNQARLQINRDDLDVVKTRNGLLPRLDVFVTLGKSGYADSFGQAAGDVFASRNYDAVVGVSGDYPLGNRAPRAQYQRALMSRDQATMSLDNLAQLVELDVRTSYVEVDRTARQLTATAATVALQEVKWRAEKDRLEQNRSPSLPVALAQRDLLTSQLAQEQAVAAYLKAFVELYRLDGSLLDRRGIAAPGRETVQVVRKR